MSGPQATRLLDILEDSATIAVPELDGPRTDHLSMPDWSHNPDTDVWTHPSPTRFDHKQYRATPPGSALVRPDGQSLAYAPRLADRGKCGDVSPCWEVQDHTLYVRGTDPTQLQLRHDPTRLDADRRTLTHSGLTPAAFVRWTAQIQNLTRQALLVPAGGSVTFRVPVPPHTQLRFGFGAPAPRHTLPPDHPTGRVTLNGTEVWTDTTTTDAAWTEHTVDLHEHAGEVVELTFSTEPGTPDATGHAVAFAEPSFVPSPAPGTTPRRVVVIGIDTLRLDHIGLHGAPADRTPGLDQWGAGAIVFDNAWAPAPRTRPSFRSALTGRWPLAAIGAPPLTQRFADAGFTTAGIVANVHLQPHLGFADGAGWWDYHDSDDAGPQVDRALDWLTAHAHEDSFLFLHLMDPHVFYMAPEPFKDAFTTGLPRRGMPDRYNRWTLQESMQKDELKPAHKAWIQARYQGELRYLDHAVSRLLAELDAMPGETWVVLLSDHGEEFWEHGGYEHNHSLHAEVMRTLLWIRPPGGWSGGPVRVDAPVSLVDLVPTLMELAQLPALPEAPTDGTSLAPWLTPGATDAQAALSAELHDRPLPMGHMMFAREAWGVLHRGWTYTLQTASGAETAYELTTDPTQQTPRLHDAPLDTLRAALSQATGWPLGTGWRLRLDQPRHAFSLTFEAPVQAAGVIDPEASRTRRANIEWGEVPPVLPPDVATVALSPDARTVTITPGPHGKGTVYILGPGPTDRAQVQAVGTDAPSIPTYDIGPGTVMLGGRSCRVAAGTLLVPEGTEAAKLAEHGSPRLLEALRAMGYIE